MKKLVTHNQGFHADDVMAYAILKEVLTKRGESWTIVRSRDQKDIDSGDIVFDIGEEYNPETNRYDHHQRGRAGARDNGVLYAASGLVWKHFGRELCSEAVWALLDKSMFQEMDASDNGQQFIKEFMFEDCFYTSIGIHIARFEPTIFEGKTPEILLSSFEEASEFARGILRRAIISEEVLEVAFQEISETYRNSEEKKILISPKNYGRPTWQRLGVYPEPVFVIYYNDKNDDWKVEAIPVSPLIRESRKNAPDLWRGRKDDQLQEITGVSDATFCHPSGFLFGAKSKEGALQLAKKALLM